MVGKPVPRVPHAGCVVDPGGIISRAPVELVCRGTITIVVVDFIEESFIANVMTLDALKKSPGIDHSIETTRGFT